MKQEMITLTKEQPQKLKKKAEIPDDALIQLKMSLEALRQGKVRGFKEFLKERKTRSSD